MTSATICADTGLSFIDCFCRECSDFRDEVARMIDLYDNHPDTRERVQRWLDRWDLSTSGVPRERVAS